MYKLLLVSKNGKHSTTYYTGLIKDYSMIFSLGRRRPSITLITKQNNNYIYFFIFMLSCMRNYRPLGLRRRQNKTKNTVLSISYWSGVVYFSQNLLCHIMCCNAYMVTYLRLRTQFPTKVKQCLENITR